MDKTIIFTNNEDQYNQVVSYLLNCKDIFVEENKDDYKIIVGFCEEENV